MFDKQESGAAVLSDRFAGAGHALPAIQVPFAPASFSFLLVTSF